MTTYLVTGGAGFIGSNYLLHVLSEADLSGREVKIINVDKLTYAGNLENLASIANDPRHIFIQADICDAKAMRQIFSEYNPDYVVNFAAESHVDRSISNPQIFVQTNVLGTVNLLQCARDLWLQGTDTNGNDCYRDGVRYLQVSTDEVYGSLGETGFFTEQTPLDPHSPYSASKASADMLVKAFGDTYRLPINITRCSNNYGPFQFPEKLIPLMLNNALQHKELPVYGDGLQVRDWLYVLDHCKAIELVLKCGEVGEVYNIGGHNERTNMQIVRTIIAEVAAHVDPKVTEALIAHVTDRKGHDRRYGIDPKKIGDALGWQPETSFEDGIVKTIQWYLSNPEWVEHVTSGAYQHYYQEMYAKR
ncbi:MAG: dTDP-glucose 4,6-dehydratase [Coriobacteriales bacterium]|jgi:dTDP-glucose 4,6-dehydratase|nr:dTDP-glucose 4,6-dehydratase [Coriobacteriales bacterium]